MFMASSRAICLLQHRARAMRQRLVMMVVDHVAEHECRRRQPGRAPQRRQVRLHDEVAVALFPVGDGVARHRLHVDVVGEQVVAAVGFLVGAVEEEIGLHALADQAALHVGEADDDRVDLATIGRRPQLFQRQ